MTPSRTLTIMIAVLLAAGAAGCSSRPSGVGPSATMSATSAPITTAAPTSASTPIGLSVDAPRPTQNDSLVLHGAVKRAATVSVGNSSVDTPAGSWSLKVPLAYGETAVLVRADDGVVSESIGTTLVRLASATLDVLYTAAVPPHASSHDVVWYDVDHLASLPMYADGKTDRAKTFSVHDLLVTWTDQSGHPVEYGGPGAFGYSVNKIDGIGQPLDASAPPYWCYKINGDGTNVLGISLQEVHAGDTVTWEFAGCA